MGRRSCGEEGIEVVIRGEAENKDMRVEEGRLEKERTLT